MSLDRVDLKTVTGSQTEVTKSALPDGASTEAKQDSAIVELSAINKEIAADKSEETHEDGLRVAKETKEILLRILNQLEIITGEESEWRE